MDRVRAEKARRESVRAREAIAVFKYLRVLGGVLLGAGAAGGSNSEGREM